MDGVRRWFQRRAISSTSGGDNNDANVSSYGQLSVSSEDIANSNSNNKNYLNKKKNNNKHSSSSSSSSQGELNIEVDFDISGLKHIKVPTRALNARSLIPSMDHHKKVSFFFNSMSFCLF